MQNAKCKTTDESISLMRTDRENYQNSSLYAGDKKTHPTLFGGMSFSYISILKRNFALCTLHFALKKAPFGAFLYFVGCYNINTCVTQIADKHISHFYGSVNNLVVDYLHTVKHLSLWNGL